MYACALRKCRFPAWLAIVALLGTALMPVSVPAADPPEKSHPCAHLSADGSTPDLSCCEGVQASKACTGDDMECVHFCSALIYTPVFHLDAVTAFRPTPLTGLNPSWLEQPPHPPPKA